MTSMQGRRWGWPTVMLSTLPLLTPHAYGQSLKTSASTPANPAAVSGLAENPAAVTGAAAAAATGAAGDGSSADGSVMALPEVSAIGVQERADGPVDGYLANRTSTATRTDTDIRNVPASINVVPRQVLVDQQVVRLIDALTNVSSVQAYGTNGSRSQNYMLRGFQSQTYAVNGVMLNPALNFPIVPRDLGNAERVEVLKGPASVLFGRGDPGGLVNIVTRAPDATPSASAQFQVGSFNFFRTLADVNGPLNKSGTLTARLTVDGTSTDSFRKLAHPTQTLFVAPSFSWKPDEQTQVRLDYEHTELRGPGDRGLVAVGNRVAMESLGRFYGEDWSKVKGSTDNIVLRADRQVNDWLSLRQVLAYTMGSGTRLIADTNSLGTTNNTVLRRALFEQQSNSGLDSQSEAVMKFDTFGLKHTTLVGFEFVTADRHIVQYRAPLATVSIFNPVHGALPGVFTLANRPATTMHLYGGYVQDQIELPLNFQLLAGFRYDGVDQTSTTGGIATRVNEAHFSPRAGLVWRPFPSLSLYTSVTSSFQPQTTTTAAGGEVSPETGVQYEVGAKWDIVPDRLAVTGALFQITKNNVATADPNNSLYSVVTGQQRVRGAEFDISGQIMPGWRVIASGSVMDPRVTRDNTYRVGTQLPGVPRISGSLWSTYQISDGDLSGLGFGGGLTAVGRRTGDLNESYSVAGYTRLDAAVFYDITPKLRFALNARNLANARYIEQPISRQENMPGAPFSVLASITSRF